MINNCFKKVFYKHRASNSCRTLTAIRQKRAPALAVSLLIGLMLGNGSGAEELNSERIERLFGNYRISVLEQTARGRLSNLHSIHDSLVTCRTLATVQYHSPVPAVLRDAHREILAGGSIGATLKNHGWQVRKLTQYVGDIEAPADARRLSTLMRIPVPRTLALHAYQLNAVDDDGGEYAYATIVELHHPDYLSVEALRELYGSHPVAPLAAGKLEEIRDLAKSSMTDSP